VVQMLHRALPYYHRWRAKACERVFLRHALVGFLRCGSQLAFLDKRRVDLSAMRREHLLHRIVEKPLQW
jgi:hypothetical protein